MCARSSSERTIADATRKKLKPTARKRAAVRPGLTGLSSFLLTNAETAWARSVENDFPADGNPPAATPAAVVPPCCPCPVAATPAVAVDDNDSTAPATAIALAHEAESCRMLITCMRRESRRTRDASLCLLLLLPGPSTAVLALPVLGGEVFLMIWEVQKRASSSLVCHVVDCSREKLQPAVRGGGVSSKSLKNRGGGVKARRYFLLFFTFFAQE